MGILVLLVAFLFQACAAPTPTPTPTPTPKEVKWLTIGVVGPFSGVGSERGLYMFHSVEIWADEINTAGGMEIGGETYMWRVVTGDNKWTPSKTVTQARRMIFEEKVQWITGPLTSSTCLAAQPIPNENQIVYLGWAISYP